VKAALLQDLAADESSVELRERTMQRLAKAALDRGKSCVEAAGEAGVSNTVVRRVVARET
jgi:hypothetical protein